MAGWSQGFYVCGKAVHYGECVWQRNSTLLRALNELEEGRDQILRGQLPRLSHYSCSSLLSLR